MKQLLSILAFFIYLNPVLSYSQYNTNNYRIPQKFKFGENYYDAKFSSLNLIMKLIESDNSDLYNKLEPSYNKLVKKRQNSILVISSSAAIGIGLIVSGLTFAQKDKNLLFKSGDPLYDPKVRQPNMELIIGGGSIMIIGGIIAAIVHPNRSDIFNFINLHNKYSPNRKLDLQLGLNYNKQNPFGLKLCLKF